LLLTDPVFRELRDVLKANADQNVKAAHAKKKLQK